MDKAINTLEHNLIRVLLKIELNGVKIDTKKLERVEHQLLSRLQTTTEKIMEIAGTEINLNSNEQLSTLLFETLELQPKVTSKGKSGLISVDKSHLGKLVNDHEIVPLILDYRKTNTLLSFCNQLKEVHPKTKRLHCNLNQIGTATGRFSCSNPNLQNIPNVKLKDRENETDEIKILASELREVFVAEKGCVLIGADYSQIELRVMAEMSQDSFLLHAYNNGIDIHELTASKVFNCKVSEVTEEQRKIAKTINFGLIYGMSAVGLAKSLTTITKKHHSKEDAEKMMSDYFAKFSGVKSCLEGLVDYADHHGYSKTLFGRTRPIPELASNTLNEREKGKRLAMNSPVQGSAADIIKMAMVNCDKAIAEKGLQSKMILQIHDELLFEVPENEVEIMEKLIKYEMENVVKLSIPLTIELGKGANWATAH
ncbi:DNA polymerase-1 [Chryseobacterium rhizosphaerae]|uniref:DNA polymerase n=1 Tax=Chryseobacterium rhizosphaerae TaxID=395937 RepID=UPI0028631C38|nr:DNA polymerase [Chryseobacterium rhizosphaerae]MDR6546681.1 DNA polymerase-1 [Chryseobacterium rhizosphaerae]MDR6546727.1 DNA polymerase-1 [Chryseobacterium rhizosphaerae]